MVITTGIIIVNYKTPHLVIKNLEALLEDKENDYSICVVDNASNDGSGHVIQSYIDNKKATDKVGLISASKNGGFAYGCNLGFSYFKKKIDTLDFYWLLNPDAVALKNARKELQNFLDKHPKVGICGSQLENIDSTVRNASFNFHNWKTELSNSLALGVFDKLIGKSFVDVNIGCPTKCDWVSGASMMLRKTMIDEIGNMDEKYFLYYEEMDFCFKAANAGWECWHIPMSRVVHIAGSSTGVNSSETQETRRPKYWFESRRRFFSKNYGLFYNQIVDILWITGYSFWLLRKLIQRKQRRFPPYFFLDFLKNSSLIKIRR